MNRRLIREAIVVVPLVSVAAVASFLYLQHQRHERAERESHSISLCVRDHEGQMRQYSIDVRQSDSTIESGLRSAIDDLFRDAAPVTAEGSTGVFWLDPGTKTSQFDVGNGKTVAVNMTQKFRSYRNLLGTKGADFRYRLESRMNDTDAWSVDCNVPAGGTASSESQRSDVRDRAIESLLHCVHQIREGRVQTRLSRTDW